MQKIKVVWLCPVANRDIANIIGVNSDLDIAPWITELIKLFKDRNDIELYIITPNYYNNKNISFYINNICIYLFKYRSFFLTRKTENLSFNYLFSRKAVGTIINKITPDLIHLHGSENAVYAASIIPLIEKYPVLVTLQGFVCLSSIPNGFLRKYVRWNRIRIERKINTKASYFTIANEEGLNTLNTFTTSAKIYRDHYPTTIPNVSSLDFPEKKYEIVYFAKISKDKGIEDLIEAVKELKVKRPDIKVLVIGGGNPSYVQFIHSVIDKYGLVDNIDFAGFQPTQQDVFKLAAQARVSVLPTHFDGIPGSIREAMIMRIPVVAYAVGGIPSFNNKCECITLVEKQNIQDLIDKIELVLNDSERTNAVVENAFEIMSDKYDNNKIYDNLLRIYNEILNDYNG